MQVLVYSSMEELLLSSYGQTEHYPKSTCNHPSVVRPRTTCERVGTKSLTLFQQLLAGGEVRSESRSVMVVFDFARQRSEPVPDAWRERLLAD